METHSLTSILKVCPFTSKATGGKYNHQLTVSQLPPHNHEISVNVSNSKNWGGNGIGCVREADNYISKQAIKNTGSGNSFNIIQPYYCVYVWKKTA